MRIMSNREKQLLLALLEANESLSFAKASHFQEQVANGDIEELGSPNFLAFKHRSNIESSAINVYRLPVELVASDEGVPVLIYATFVETNDGAWWLDTFVVDRLDGGVILEYPTSASEMMLVKGGKMIGGVDLRHIYSA